MYKIFYATDRKWHTCDKITGLATCGNFLIQQDNSRSIHVETNKIGNPHPLLCRRCLTAKK